MDNEIESIDNQSEEVAVAAAAAAASIMMGLIGSSSTPLYRERLSPSSLPLLGRDKPMLKADTAWPSSKPDRAPNLQTRLR